MKRLGHYHISLINHFCPPDVQAGFWYDYVTRLSNLDAKKLFKRYQHSSLKVIYKPRKSNVVKVMREQIKSVKASCKKQTRAKYASSPQANIKDRRVKTTRYGFQIKE